MPVCDLNALDSALGDSGQFGSIRPPRTGRARRIDEVGGPQIHPLGPPGGDRYGENAETGDAAMITMCPTCVASAAEEGAAR